MKMVISSSLVPATPDSSRTKIGLEVKHCSKLAYVLETDPGVRFLPKSYAQGLGEVQVTQKFLENFSGDLVRFLARSFAVPGNHLGQQSTGLRWQYGPVWVRAEQLIWYGPVKERLSMISDRYLFIACRNAKR